MPLNKYLETAKKILPLFFIQNQFKKSSGFSHITILRHFVHSVNGRILRSESY